MLDDLLFLSNNDLPFVEAQVNIHQPTLSEISLIGEESFISGVHFLNFSKATLPDEDKLVLGNKSDFEVFMSIMCGEERFNHKNNAKMVLTLMFPDYQIYYQGNEIILTGKNSISRINTMNYDAFKTILVKMFGLNESSGPGDYNPADARAAKIAEKLRQAKARKAKNNGGQNQSNSIYANYISILAVALGKNISDLMQYTVYQLRNEFARYQKKQAFDFFIQARMAGAQDLDEVDNWME